MRWASRFTRGVAPRLALWLLASSGCAGSDPRHDEQADAADHDAAPDDDAGAPSCTDALAICDIREPGCQQTIAQAVACLRGREPQLPAVRLVSEEEYADRLQAFTAPEDAAEVMMRERWFRGLAAFGLTLPDQSEAQRAAASAERVIAAYLYDTREIVVIDRGRPLDDADAVITLAHELVHVQQDAERGLMAWSERHGTSDDRVLATACLVEGEATHYGYVVAIALRGAAAEDFDWERMYADWQDEVYVSSDDDASPYTSMMLEVPYAFGGAFVTRAWLRAGQAGIDALYAAPPESSREVVLGDAEGEAEARAVLNQVAVPYLSRLYNPVSVTTLGAWTFRAFLRRAGLDEAAALRAAESLGADVFTVLVHRSYGTLISSWRLQLLDGSELDWIDDIAREGVAVRRDGSLLTLVAAEQEVLDQLDNFTWIAAPVL